MSSAKMNPRRMARPTVSENNSRSPRGQHSILQNSNFAVRQFCAQPRIEIDTEFYPAKSLIEPNFALGHVGFNVRHNPKVTVPRFAEHHKPAITTNSRGDQEKEVEKTRGMKLASTTVSAVRSPNHSDALGDEITPESLQKLFDEQPNHPDVVEIAGDKYLYMETKYKEVGMILLLYIKDRQIQGYGFTTKNLSNAMSPEGFSFVNALINLHKNGITFSPEHLDYYRDMVLAKFTPRKIGIQQEQMPPGSSAKITATLKIVGRTLHYTQHFIDKSQNINAKAEHIYKIPSDSKTSEASAKTPAIQAAAPATIPDLTPQELMAMINANPPHPDLYVDDKGMPYLFVTTEDIVGFISTDGNTLTAMICPIGSENIDPGLVILNNIKTGNRDEIVTPETRAQLQIDAFPASLKLFSQIQNKNEQNKMFQNLVKIIRSGLTSINTVIQIAKTTGHYEVEGHDLIVKLDNRPSSESTIRLRPPSEVPQAVVTANQPPQLFPTRFDKEFAALTEKFNKLTKPDVESVTLNKPTSQSGKFSIATEVPATLKVSGTGKFENIQKSPKDTTHTVTLALGKKGTAVPYTLTITGAQGHAKRTATLAPQNGPTLFGEIPVDVTTDKLILKNTADKKGLAHFNRLVNGPRLRIERKENELIISAEGDFDKTVLNQFLATKAWEQSKTETDEPSTDIWQITHTIDLANPEASLKVLEAAIDIYKKAAAQKRDPVWTEKETKPISPRHTDLGATAWLTDAVNPPSVLGTVVAAPAAAFSSQPISIAPEAYIKFPRGEILVTSQDTIRDMNAHKQMINGEEHLVLPPGLFWYGLQAKNSGVTILVPVRFRPDRPSAPLDIDTSIHPRAYVTGTSPDSAVELTSTRLVLQNNGGHWQIILFDASLGEEQIKESHFVAVISKDNPVLVSMVDIMGSNGKRVDNKARAALIAETHQANNTQVCQVLRTNVTSLPPAIYTKPQIQISKTKEVKITYFAGTQRWVRLSDLSSRDGHLFVGEQLTLTIGSETWSADATGQDVTVAVKPIVPHQIYELIQVLPEGDLTTPRRFVWYKEIGGLVEVQDEVELSGDEANIAAVLKTRGFVLPAFDTAKPPYTVRSRNQGSQPSLAISDAIRTLPDHLHSYHLPKNMIAEPTAAQEKQAIDTLLNSRLSAIGETLDTMVMGGSVRETFTFTAPENRVAISFPVEASGKKYTPRKTHRDAPTPLRLIVALPNEEAHVALPARLFYENEKYHVIVGAQQRTFSLRLPSTSETINGREANGMVFEDTTDATHALDVRVRGSLREQLSSHGLGKHDGKKNLVAPNSKPGEKINLTDNRILELKIIQNQDGGYELDGVDLPDTNDKNDHATIEYLDVRTEQKGRMTLLRSATDEGKLFLQDDDAAQTLYTLSISDDGKAIIKKRPPVVSEKESPQHIMIDSEGKPYAKSTSPAVQWQLTENGVWPKRKRIATDLARSQGTAGHALSTGAETESARARFEYEVAQGGKCEIISAEIKEEGEDKPWQKAEFKKETYDNGRVRVYVRGSERRVTNGREREDYAWMDFPNEEALTSDKFAMEASYYNREGLNRNVMPREDISKTKDALMMIYGALAFTAEGNPTPELTAVQARLSGAAEMLEIDLTKLTLSGNDLSAIDLIVDSIKPDTETKRDAWRGAAVMAIKRFNEKPASSPESPGLD